MNNPSSFHDLPDYLQAKILGPEKINLAPLTSLRCEMQQKMNSSIYPVKYLSVVSLDALGAPAASRELPPITNRGVTGESPDSENLPSWESKENIRIVPIGKGSKYKLIAIPEPDRDKSQRYSFVDWVSFTFKVDDYPLTLSSGHVCLCDHDYVTAFSAQIEAVFGYGVGHKREHGMNFYKHAYDLGENGAGNLCVGGQRGSIQVQVKGQGLMASKPGWEWRLFKLLQRIPGAKLTRVDLASDDFHSDIDIESYVQMYHAGMFVNRGQAPNIEQAGNWIAPNGKGRTLYIGCRSSGKLLRIYEKGLQIANGYHEMYPNWLRVELELKNEGRVIPFEVLIRPGQYLAGAYPALANMHKVQDRIETQKKIVKGTFERAIETTREQFGRYIWTAIEILGVDEAIRRFTDGKQEIPKRLNFDTFEQFQYPWLHTDSINTVHLADVPI